MYRAVILGEWEDRSHDLGFRVYAFITPRIQTQMAKRRENQNGNFTGALQALVVHRPGTKSRNNTYIGADVYREQSSWSLMGCSL